MPMPNAIVATMISPSSRRNRDWLAARIRASSPAWYGRATNPSDDRNSAVLSTEARDRQYTMPASPRCSVRSSRSSCLRGSFFGSIRYWILGRSKLATKCRAAPSPRRVTISPSVCRVAVAVTAIRGTEGHRSCSTDSPR